MRLSLSPPSKDLTLLCSEIFLQRDFDSILSINVAASTTFLLFHLYRELIEDSPMHFKATTINLPSLQRVW